MMNLLTVDELAKTLGVKPKTLYQWANLGQIPSYKINGCLRFDPDEIQMWLKTCRREPQNGYNLITQARGPRKGGK